MATTAESARRWLDEKNPAPDEISEVIGKLQARIEAWPEDEERVQGLIEALDTLENALQSASSGNQAEEGWGQLDTRPLVEHTEVVRERPPEEKRALFEQLKQSIGQKPDSGRGNQDT